MKDIAFLCLLLAATSCNMAIPFLEEAEKDIVIIEKASDEINAKPSAR